MEYKKGQLVEVCIGGVWYRAKVVTVGSHSVYVRVRELEMTANLITTNVRPVSKG